MTNILFWKIAKALSDTADLIVKNDKGVVIEKGQILPNDMSITFGLDAGVVTLYGPDNTELFRFDESSPLPGVFKELLINAEVVKEIGTAPEVPVQEQANRLHTLNIHDNTLMLDDFTLKGVTNYNLSNGTSKGMSEVNINLIIDSKIDF